MAQEFSTVDALKQQVANVQLAVESQRVCRAGVEAMIAAGGNTIQTAEFLGAHAMVLAHAVRVVVAACGVTEEQALQALIGNTRVALAGGLGPWSNPERGLR